MLRSSKRVFTLKIILISTKSVFPLRTEVKNSRIAVPKIVQVHLN